MTPCDTDNLTQRLDAAHRRLELGDLAGAVTAIDALLRRWPDHPRLRRLHARALLAAQQPEQAIRTLDAAVCGVQFGDYGGGSSVARRRASPMNSSSAPRRCTG